ncbi:MAG: outer membrane beta-barrel protein [Chitinophagaceae bacterium]
MKKILIASALFLVAGFVKAQDSTSTPKKTNTNKIDLSNRANDHFMLQYGIDGWNGTPDSTTPSGFSRHFNVYLLIDKPFKASPHLSVAFGLGLGSSNIFFKNTYIDLKSLSPTLPFTDVSAANHFKKYKLTTVFLELPVELRFASNPVTPDKGFKVALGAKIGTLLNAHTKGKNLENSSGATVYGAQYIAKETDKRFINSTRLAVTARIGYGNLSLDGSYQVTSFLKDGTGPVIHPYSVGLTLSGL